MTSRLVQNLERRQIEQRIMACWHEQQAAELAGDDSTVDAMNDTINELLEQWQAPRQRTP